MKRSVCDLIGSVTRVSRNQGVAERDSRGTKERRTTTTTKKKKKKKKKKEKMARPPWHLLKEARLMARDVCSDILWHRVPAPLMSPNWFRLSAWPTSKGRRATSTRTGGKSRKAGSDYSLSLFTSGSRLWSCAPCIVFASVFSPPLSPPPSSAR